MSKFNIGDKVRIVGCVPNKDFRRFYNLRYRPHVGEITTVTEVLSTPWEDSDYFCYVESNECAWFDNELELVKDDFDIEEKV